jgi:hypothetical protein
MLAKVAECWTSKGQVLCVNEAGDFPSTKAECRRFGGGNVPLKVMPISQLVLC